MIYRNLPGIKELVDTLYEIDPRIRVTFVELFMDGLVHIRVSVFNYEFMDERGNIVIQKQKTSPSIDIRVPVTRADKEINLLYIEGFLQEIINIIL